MNVQGKMKARPLLKKGTVTKLLPLIDLEGVSLVARGMVKSTQTNQGFLQAFYKNQTDSKATKNQTWLERRQGFINRHYRKGRKLWKPNGNPTRLHLALIAWGYSPEPQKLKEYIRREGLKNRAVKPFVNLD